MTTQGKRIDDPLADLEPRESDYGTDGVAETTAMAVAYQQLGDALNEYLGGGVEVLADGSIAFESRLIEVCTSETLATGLVVVRPRARQAAATSPMDAIATELSRIFGSVVRAGERGLLFDGDRVRVLDRSLIAIHQIEVAPIPIHQGQK